MTDVQVTEPASSNRTPPVPALLLTTVLSLGAQLILLASGYLSVAADDAARVIRAREPLTLSMLFEPDVWLPLDKLAYSAVLGVWNDPVWGPRVLTGVAGVAVSIVVVWLAARLFEDEKAVYITALLVSVAPHRLFFSVSTMSEIFYFLAVLLASVFLIGWLENGRYLSLLSSSFLLASATLVRYEAWVIAAVWAIAMVWWWIRGRLSFGQVAVLGGVLVAFPAGWLAANLASAELVDYLSITRQQAELAGATTTQALSASAAARFMVDLVWAPMLALGVFGAIGWVRERSWRGTLMWMMFIPLLAISLATVVTGSVPFAATWRLSGVWVLFCIPIASGVAVAFAQRGSRAHLAVWLVVGVSLLGWAVRDFRLASTSELTWEEVDFARTLDSQAAGYMIEIRAGDDFDFLDLIASSAEPDKYELTIGHDPYLVALFIRRLDDWQSTGPELVSEYARVRYDLAQPAHLARALCDYDALLLRSDSPTLGRTDLEPGPTTAGWAMIEAEC